MGLFKRMQEKKAIKAKAFEIKSRAQAKGHSSKTEATEDQKFFKKILDENEQLIEQTQNNFSEVFTSVDEMNFNDNFANDNNFTNETEEKTTNNDNYFESDDLSGFGWKAQQIDQMIGMDDIPEPSFDSNDFDVPDQPYEPPMMDIDGDGIDDRWDDDINI